MCSKLDFGLCWVVGKIVIDNLFFKLQLLHTQDINVTLQTHHLLVCFVLIFIVILSLQGMKKPLLQNMRENEFQAWILANVFYFISINIQPTWCV